MLERSNAAGGGVDTRTGRGHRAARSASTSAAEERGHVDRRDLLVRELRVDSRQLADAGDQPLQPIDVARQHPEKALTLGGIVGRGDDLGSDANRRQRVLELVRDVSRERLEQADVRVQPSRQLLERAREVSDLVFSVDAPEAGRRRPAIGERQRGAAETHERPHNRRRHQQPDDDGRPDRRDDDLEDAQPHVVERLQNPERRLRHERGADDAVAMADGHGAVERQRALAGSGPDRGAVASLERCPHFGPGVSVAERHRCERSAAGRRDQQRASDRPGRAAHANDPGADPIEEALADANDALEYSLAASSGGRSEAARSGARTESASRTPAAS